MSPKVVDKTAKRQEILDAALRVFARKGFKNTKMIDIAEEAGIGKGTIYEYFRHKDEMLLAAFANYIQQGDAVVKAVLASPRSPVDKIQEILRGTVEVYGRDPEVARVFFDFWAVGMQNAEQPEIDFRPIYARYRALSRELLAQAVAAGQVRGTISEHTASILIGVVEGLFLQWIVDPSAFSLQDTVAGVIDTLFHGILER